MIGLVMALASCGGDSKGSGDEAGPAATTTTRVGVEITGTSAADRKMVADLSDYVERGCRGTESLSALRQALDARPGAMKRVRERFGSVAGVFEDPRFQQVHRVCASYQQLVVDKGVITVRSSLGDDDEGRRDAQIVCDTIQGSDVADYTTHTVVGADSTQLATCPSLRDPGP